MKYLVILGDGMADRPIEALGNQTPLAFAKTPVMDELAAKGEIGMVHTIPDGMSPGSDTANLAVMGYNPREYYTGRSPLEALSIGVPMMDTDVAMRCNFVTLSEEEPYEKKRIRTRFCASTTRVLILFFSHCSLLSCTLYHTFQKIAKF